jgi:hypothetical protein
MNNEYVALIGYAVAALLVFIGGILWQKYRQFIVRVLNLKHYYHDDNDKPPRVAPQHR